MLLNDARMTPEQVRHLFNRKAEIEAIVRDKSCTNANLLGLICNAYDGATGLRVDRNCPACLLRASEAVWEAMRDMKDPSQIETITETNQK